VPPQEGKQQQNNYHIKVLKKYNNVSIQTSNICCSDVRIQRIY